MADDRVARIRRGSGDGVTQRWMRANLYEYRRLRRDRGDRISEADRLPHIAPPVSGSQIASGARRSRDGRHHLRRYSRRCQLPEDRLELACGAAHLLAVKCVLDGQVAGFSPFTGQEGHCGLNGRRLPGQHRRARPVDRANRQPAPVLDHGSNVFDRPLDGNHAPGPRRLLHQPAPVHRHANRILQCDRANAPRCRNLTEAVADHARGFDAPCAERADDGRLHREDGRLGHFGVFEPRLRSISLERLDQ